MAEEINGLDDKTQEKRSKKHDKQAADLEKVTDFMEEIESLNITNVSCKNNSFFYLLTIF